nr:MAG TPA: hypothetical protein [Caudoviricetes sp.]DAU85803.1 MAG TPA: hypothetical protein [Caudoviricetes sp.]
MQTAIGRNVKCRASSFRCAVKNRTAKARNFRLPGVNTKRQHLLSNAPKLAQWLPKVRK